MRGERTKIALEEKNILKLTNSRHFFVVYMFN